MTPQYYRMMDARPKEAEYLEEWAMRIGIPQNICGYYQLLAAIMLVRETPTLGVKQVTRVLYPAVAKMFDSRPSCVERNIRRVLETNNFDMLGLNNLSNSKLITYMANKLRREVPNNG